MNSSQKNVSFSHVITFYIKENPDWTHSRKSEWEKDFSDYIRFKQRIIDLSVIIEPILSPNHRANIIIKNGNPRTI